MVWPIHIRKPGMATRAATGVRATSKWRKLANDKGDAVKAMCPLRSEALRLFAA